MTRLGTHYFLSVIAFLAFNVLTMALPLYADIYTYTDSQGVRHFTNVPTSSKYKIYIKEKSRQSVNTYETDRYDDLITKASNKYGVSFSLLKALIKTESDFDPWAVSKVGAKGLMQIMPENLKRLNINDPFDPRENIMGGTLYLKQLIKRFNGKLSLALAAYNAGPKMVENYQRIPPFPETEDFVKRVMKYYAVFKKG
ncbi:MAG: lytic transglycosylase domain-containing protein [Desulfobacterales bacterium]|nr:MAG: lytic transglycosylase domain-containing protein [Desulfobacterales bacterium]